MKLNEHERTRPNIAGLMSPVQQAEMKLLLAGRWPSLRPLPVFKLETDAYRVSIDFDKTRGEWLCRKTSLPSNKVQELRGGLTEIIRALPDGQAVLVAECLAAGQQEQELDKDASRRLRAMLEWRENYENGARYSDLQNYLSESQQHEIDDIIRLTLTARQLQFCPKNVAYVFDALSKAGGKLATLLEIAHRNRMGQQTELPATAEEPTPDPERCVPVENPISATLESIPDAPMGSISPQQEQPSSPELMVHTSSQVSNIVTLGILDAKPQTLIEDSLETEHHHVATPNFGAPVRKCKVQSPANRVENSQPRQHVLEISGFHLAAFAAVFLFAVISLPIGLTVGRGPLGQWLRDTQKSMLAIHLTSPALPDHPVESASRISIPPALELEESRAVGSSAPSLTDADNASTAAEPLYATLSEETSKESTPDSESIVKVPATDSHPPPTSESKPTVDSAAHPGRNRSAGLIARNALPPLGSNPSHSPKAVGPMNDTLRKPAPRRVAPSTGASPRWSPPSAILVTAPAYGSKPFRVTFSEKPIAASSSFAVTSELSVLVPAQPGPATARKPARLQAGELVYFVWPHYPRPGDRYGAAETVKVRTTIGPLGQVLDIKLVSGSVTLLPATMSAVRQWRYRPTLLNKKPVQVQQDVTIEFRPPQFLSQVHAQHPSHN